MHPTKARKALSLILVWGLLSCPFLRAERLDNRNYYDPIEEPRSPRGFIVPPLLSLILPGFDQWIEGQHQPATFYTAAGIAGILLTKYDRENIDNRYRDFAWQIYFTAGALSLHHSFRTAVASRKSLGDFAFLQNEKTETPMDLVYAPIRFSYMGRLTTILPLVAGAGLFLLLGPNKNDEAASATFGDLFYSTGISYMTGVGEEALFRGYVLPMMMHYSDGNAHLSIGGSSLLFAIGHGIRFNHFVTSFFFGLYAGWLTQENGWTLGEVAFIHTWWDIMAFVADYTNHREHAFLRLPPIHFRF